MNEEKQKTCPCPELDLRKWEDSTISFQQKPFLSRTIPRFLWVPIGLREEIDALYAQAFSMRLKLSTPTMLLEREGGAFRGQILLGVSEEGDFPGKVLLSGLYRTTVHLGSPLRLGSARRVFLSRIKRELGIVPTETFYWYVNCPECWQKTGGPATIVLARIGAPTLESSSL